MESIRISDENLRKKHQKIYGMSGVNLKKQQTKCRNSDIVRKNRQKTEFSMEILKGIRQKTEFEKIFIKFQINFYVLTCLRNV